MEPQTNVKRSNNEFCVTLNDGGGGTRVVRTNSKHRCCCGVVHVKTATTWIAYVGFFLSLFVAVSAAISRSPLSTLSWMLDAILFGCILYAQRKQMPGFFLPYLIIEGIILAFTGFVNIFIGLSAFSSDAIRYNNLYVPEYIRALGLNARKVGGFVDASFFGAYAILWANWFCWFWLYTLMLRAWEYEKELKKGNDVRCKHSCQVRLI